MHVQVCQDGGGDQVEGNELVIEAANDQAKMLQAIDDISSNRNNWIVSNIKKEGHD